MINCRRKLVKVLNITAGKRLAAPPYLQSSPWAASIIVGGRKGRGIVRENNTLYYYTTAQQLLARLACL